MVMATPSYKERMAAARAEASALRRAQRDANRARIELRVIAQLMALGIVHDQIRASGERITDYRPAELRARAREIAEGPWMVLRAKREIAERRGAAG